MRLRTGGQAHFDLGPAGRIKVRPEPHQFRQDLRRWVGLDRIVNARASQTLRQGRVFACTASRSTTSVGAQSGSVQCGAAGAKRWGNRLGQPARLRVRSWSSPKDPAIYDRSVPSETLPSLRNHGGKNPWDRGACVGVLRAHMGNIPESIKENFAAAPKLALTRAV